MAWGCGEKTILTTKYERPDACNGMTEYRIIYRNDTWQYNVSIENDRIKSVYKTNLNFWP